MPFISEADSLMIVPMLILGVGAVIFGYVTHDLYLNQGQSIGLTLPTLPGHFMEGLLDLGSYLLTGSVILGFLPLFAIMSLFFLVPSVTGYATTAPAVPFVCPDTF
jgi:hypothetical protein